MLVRVSVPASVANLGPGFDCLGLALGLYHRVSVWEEDGDGVDIRARGEGARDLPLDEDNLIYRALRKTCERFGYQPRRLSLESSNGIPLAAGLGSSAAARIAGMAAGTLLSGQPLDRDRLIRWGTEQEGHADNVAPCVLGGMTTVVGADSAGEVRCLRLDPPHGLIAQIAIPDFPLPTEQARTVLPESLDYQDAIFNQSRVGLLAAAMSSGRTDMLAWAMQDRLHQPYREKLVPGLTEVMAAAMAAGSVGTALSGAGPAVLALCVQSKVKAIGTSMVETWKRNGIEARVLTLAPDRRGLLVDGQAEHNT